MDSWIRRHSVFLLAFSFLLFCGSWFVLFAVDTTFNSVDCNLDRNLPAPCYQQEPDVPRYITQARNQDVAQWFGFFRSVWNPDSNDAPRSENKLFGGIGLTNILVLFVIKIGMTLVPGAPYLGAYFVQLALLPVFYICLRRLAVRIPDHLHNLFYAVCLLGPITLVGIVSPAKEYLSLLFVTAMAVCALEKRRMLLIILAFVSPMVREVNILIGALFFLLTFQKVRFWYLAVAFSLAIPMVNLAVPGFKMLRSTWSLWLNEGSSFILSPLATIQDLPFGHLVAAPLIFAVNILGPAVGPSVYQAYFQGTFGFYQLMGVLAADVCIIAGGQALWGCWRYKLWSHPFVGFLGSIILATAVLPLNQFRYYYPIWPLVFALALIVSVRPPKTPEENP